MNIYEDEAKVRFYIEKYKMEEFYSEDMIQHTAIHEFKKGENMAEYGQEVKYIHFVVSGTAKIYILLSNGKSLLLRFYRPINTIGDLELMIEKQYTANAEAITDCVCFALPIQYVRNHYDENVGLLKYMNKSLARKLYSISHKSTTNIYYPLKNRFCSYLVAYMDQLKILKLENSYTDIADLLGTSYRHLNRVIKELTEEEIITKKGRSIQITNQDKLEDLAGDIYIDLF